MDEPRDLTQFDARLRPLLDASDDAEAGRCLDALLATHATPLVERIVRTVLRRGAARENGEDLKQEALARLTRHLRELQAGRGAAVVDFDGYVARATYNVWNEHVRARYPERVKLKDRIRYLLNHRPDLAYWRDDRGRPLCGRVEWAGRSDAVAADRLDALRSRVDTPARRDAAALAHCLASTFEGAGAPIALDDLVALVTSLGWITERASVQLDEVPERSYEPSGVAGGAVDGLVTLEALSAVWAEIERLPPNQRAALLLNLRDARGGADVGTFLRTGTASPDAIAAAVGCPVDDLTSLLSRLPIDDATIAARLGTTGRNVISLRQSARQRLTRRLKGVL